MDISIDKVRQNTLTSKQGLTKAAEKRAIKLAKQRQQDEGIWEAYWSPEGAGWQHLQDGITEASCKGQDSFEIKTSYHYSCDRHSLRFLIPHKKCWQRLEEEGFTVDRSGGFTTIRW